MKRIIVILALVFGFTLNSFAQEELPTYNGKIDQVKVFLQQAQIEKTVSFPLKQGNNEIILSGNSQYMQTQSLQFTSINDFIITDFTPFIQYVQPTQPSEEKLSNEKKLKLKILRDSLEILSNQNSDSYTLTSILSREKQVLDNMKIISQPQSIDSIPKIKDGLSYYRDKMVEISKMLQKENAIVSKRSIRIKEINNQINIILQGAENNFQPRNEYYIRLNIYSEKNIPMSKLSYTYNVGGVYWQPFYDVKFTKPTDPASFVLKAQLTQQTGEDWNDVKLIFSTEQPNNRRVLGTLYPYYLQPQQQHARTYRKQTNNIESISAKVAGVSEDAAEYGVPTANATKYSEMTVSQITMLGKEYEVGMKHTIISDGKEKTISLETKSTKADYKHYTIPKIGKAAYISALMPQWEDLELMDASGKIYLENNYINDTYISSSNTEDTLNLSIGQDKRVAVDRKVAKTKPEKTGLLSNTIETIVTITLSIKNNNQTPIDINVVDQIPLSNQENIKITAGDLSKAQYDEKTGKLTWDFSLKALEQKTITFNYIVRQPKGVNIILN
ncbi:MAG: mucoidy inhibitor MuiA family protein [Bacteroidia bacterium]|nr:mucoidy inhibitor MuiA family protein [Bacteroidia bacterium]